MACNQAASEFFESGLSAYTLVLGSASRYTISSGYSGNGLYFGPSTTSFITKITRPVTALTLCRLSFKFKIDSDTQADDAVFCGVSNSLGTTLVALTPMREAAFDSARRPLLVMAGLSNQYMGSAKIENQTWYQFDFERDETSGDYTATITKLADSSVHSTVSGVNFGGVGTTEFLFFQQDQNGPMVGTTFDDVFVYGVDVLEPFVYDLDLGAGSYMLNGQSAVMNYDGQPMVGSTQRLRPWYYIPTPMPAELIV